MRRAWQMYLLLEGKTMIRLYPLLVSIFSLTYLDLSDPKVSSDITQSISKQVRKDVYGVKYISNVKFCLL